MTTLRCRNDFPLLEANPFLAFLDSAASAQKPAEVLAAHQNFYATSYANIHRGVYDLSEAASQCYERARAKAGKFIGGASRGVVFTKNSTEAANLLAHGLAERLHPGAGVLCSTLEHHSNLLPWRAAAQRRGSFVRSIPVSPDGVLLLEDLDAMLEDIKVLTITGMSNVTGEIPNLAPLVEAAHAVGAIVVVDGAQLVPHHPVNVAALDVDALFFSGHKLGAPTGIAVLWAKPELLEEMPPFHLGGGMIETVTDTGFTPAPVPLKFEAGTPPIAEAVGLEAALDYLSRLGMDNVRAHERALVAYTLCTLTDRFGDLIHFHGPRDAAVRGGVFSFTFAGVHPHDVGQILNENNVSVRTGHHCAQPLMRALKVPATTRASTWVYTTTEDIDALGVGLEKVLSSGLVL